MKLQWFYLALGLFLGILVLYTNKPSPKIILKRPTPDNLDGTVYKDDDNVCYKYKRQYIEKP